MLKYNKCRKEGDGVLYMGIDIGSSGCKVSVVNETGELLCFSDRRYSFVHENGTSELNPDLVFEETKSAIKEIATKTDLSQLATLSVTSFGEMFVLLDENRKVLANSISYDDHRGGKETDALSEALGEDTIYSITGTTPNAMYSLPKLMWIKKHRPDIYARANKVCLFADFILIKLGAEYHIDYSLAARTLMFDVKDKCWSKKILSYAEIEAEKLAKPVPSGTIVGKISKGLACELGLPEGVQLLAGGHDQSCAALGAGIIKEGMALDGMGSNECIVPCFERAMINDTMKRSNLACVPFIIPDKYVTYAFNRTCGTVLDWYRGLIGNVSYDELLGEMEDIPTKKFFLPHFAGAATPYMDDDATGALVGLDLTTTRGQITKGIIEGFNYEIMTNLECLRESGFKVRELYVSGGMSQNDRVLQIKADVLGLPIHRLEHTQTGTMAMAILGSVATNVYADIPAAVAGLVRSSRTFEPDKMQHEMYRKLFEQYKNMYTAVKMIQGRK